MKLMASQFRVVCAKNKEMRRAGVVAAVAPAAAAVTAVSAPVPTPAPAAGAAPACTCPPAHLFMVVLISVLVPACPC